MKPEERISRALKPARERSASIQADGDALRLAGLGEVYVFGAVQEQAGCWCGSVANRPALNPGFQGPVPARSRLMLIDVTFVATVSVRASGATLTDAMVAPDKLSRVGAAVFNELTPYT